VRDHRQRGPQPPVLAEPSAPDPPKDVAGDFASWRKEQSGTRWDQPAFEAAIERRIRQLALPVALVVAWGIVHAGFPRSLLRIFLSMWVHELGHALAAWLCGRFAFPGPWFTPVGATRSWLVVAVVAAVLVLGIFRAWRSRRTGWGVFHMALLVVQMLCTFALHDSQATSFIIWSGDGGAMLIGTALMLSLYARRSSQLRIGWLRWGFLVIGAAAYADSFATWWAARDNLDAIPFGENEGRGLSDPTVLVFQQSFSVRGMVDGYVWVGIACLVVLALAYALGLRRNRGTQNES
jgi:hypothetical protein